MQISAPLMRSPSQRHCSASAGSTTTLFLPRFHIEKPGVLRVGSPEGGSILTTSAPKSAMNMPTIGPAIPLVTSTTCRVPRAYIVSLLVGENSDQLPIENCAV